MTNTPNTPNTPKNTVPKSHQRAAAEDATAKWQRAGTPEDFRCTASSPGCSPARSPAGGQTKAHLYLSETFPLGGQLYKLNLLTDTDPPQVTKRFSIALTNGVAVLL